MPPPFTPLTPGFFMKTVDSKPNSAISVANHSASCAFLGPYLCLPDFRGQGHGIEVWNAALNHVGNRTIGLDGEPDQQGKPQVGVRSLRTNRALAGKLSAGESTARPVIAGDLGAVSEMNRAQTGFGRSRFLDAWFGDANTRQSFVIERGGAIPAYATIRSCREGSKLGLSQQIVLLMPRSCWRTGCVYSRADYDRCFNGRSSPCRFGFGLGVNPGF